MGWLTKSNAIWAASTAAVAFLTIALASQNDALRKTLNGEMGLIEGLTSAVTGG